DPRFVMPTPAPWKRAAFLVLLVFCFWLAFQIKGERAKPKVVHANRYSKQYKYRPAASPIVTETLKDGRVRVRGAAPTSFVIPPGRTRWMPVLCAPILCFFSSPPLFFLEYLGTTLQRRSTLTSGHDAHS
ncbi:hypothetical protein B0H16DRAFT_1313977, partial [Mycena metata]